MVHDHSRGATGAANRGRLRAALAITLTVLVAEVVGAVVTGSLALLSDAGHMLTDAAGLAIALVAIGLAARPTSHRWTFGWQRAEVLAALVNGVVLVAVSVLVLVEAVRRWQDPGEVEGTGMLVFGAVGLVANLVAMRLLRDGQKENLNLRGAYLEVLGDLVGSVAVIVAAVVIAVTGWVRADAVASVAIAVLILPRAASLLREVAKVLLEGTPEHLELVRVREHLEATDGVVAVHDLHAWTITSGMPVLTAHVVVEDRVLAPDRFCEVLDGLQSCLRGHFDVEHSTFQLEPVSHDRHDELAAHG